MLVFTIFVTINTAETRSPLIMPIRPPCRVTVRGVQAWVPRVPRQCCSRGNVVQSVSRQSGSGGCAQTVCPLLAAIKGCNFMCQFDMCCKHYCGLLKCMQQCVKSTTTGSTSITKTINTLTTTSSNSRTAFPKFPTFPSIHLVPRENGTEY